jgi:hypothetical protein
MMTRKAMMTRSKDDESTSLYDSLRERESSNLGIHARTLVI